MKTKNHAARIKILAVSLVVIVTTLATSVESHVSKVGVNRFFVADKVDGNLVVYGRVPLPIILSNDIEAASQTQSEIKSPFLRWNGRDYVIQPDLVARNAAEFADRIARSHEWQVDGQIALPEVSRVRLALASQEQQLLFGREPEKILGFPSHNGPAPLGETLVDFQLDFGPVRAARVTVRYANPPLDLPPTFVIGSHLVDATGNERFEMFVEGQMLTPEDIVVPRTAQMFTGFSAGLLQAVLGLFATTAAAILLSWRGGAIRLGWLALGLVAGQAGAATAALALPQLTGLPWALPSLAALALAALLAALLLRREMPVLIVFFALVLGAANTIDGAAAAGPDWARSALRIGFHIGMLAGLGLLLAAASLALLAGRSRPRRLTVPIALAVVAALSAGSFAVQRTAPQPGPAERLVRLAPDDALAEAHALAVAMLSDLHQAAQAGDAPAELALRGAIPAAAATALADTGLAAGGPPHEVEILSLHARRDGGALRIGAQWRTLGLNSTVRHTHVPGNSFAADFVLKRRWGRWKFAAFTPRPLQEIEN